MKVLDCQEHGQNREDQCDICNAPWDTYHREGNDDLVVYDCEHQVIRVDSHMEELVGFWHRVEGFQDRYRKGVDNAAAVK